MRDRPWHVAMGALALGLGLAESPTFVVMAVAGLGAVALTAVRAPSLGALAAALVVAGAALGGLRLAAIDAPAGRVRDGQHVSMRAWALQRPRPGRFGSSLEARAAGGRLSGARLLLRVPTWSSLPDTLREGDELTLRGDLSAVGGRHREAGAFGAYLRRRGVAAEVYVDAARLTGRHRAGLAGALDRMRVLAERAVAAGMSRPQGELLRGMVLGEDEAISHSTRADFRASGLAHLLAVSGQNVALLAALALPLLALAGLGIRGRLVGLVAVIGLYVPLAGAGPSLQRAGAMGAAAVVATALSRPASATYALLLAAAGTLALNPRISGDPGWQLSFAAVAGIVLLAPPLRRGLRGVAASLMPPTREASPRGRAITLAVCRAAADGVAVSVAATVATAPLLASHFGSVPLAALPANVLALPAIPPVMWLGMVKVAIGQLAALGPGAAAAGVADGALGSLAAPPLDYLAWLAERFGDLGGGHVAPALRSPVAVVGAYAALMGGWAAIGRAMRPVRDRGPELAAAWRRLSRARRAALALLLLSAAFLAAARTLQAPGPPSAFTVRFLDVGQGDATLIQDPLGAAILFDGGPPEADIVRLLRRAGVRALSAVVATHPSRDHHGGLLEVLERFRVGTFVDGGDGTRDPTFRAVEAEARRRGARIVPARAGVDFSAGAVRVAILSPPPRPPGPPPEDPNPRAVVAIVSDGAFDLMLSADAESEALLPLRLPPVEAMKVPHHGSADQGLPDVLERLRPRIAAIEVGKGNPYDHPRPSTLRALSRAGVRTYRTDRDGTVTLGVDGGGMHVTTER